MSAIAKFLGGVAGAVGLKILDPLINDALKGVGDIIRTEFGINVGYVKNVTAEAMDSMLETDPHGNVGVDPSGIVYVMQEMLRATARIGILIGSEVAEELFMELVQEGYSNAIQTSIGGALQSILNVWRGSMPLNPDEASEVVRLIDVMDSDTCALLIAQAGNNLPTTFFRAIRGWKDYVDDQTRSLRLQLMEILRKWNEAIAWLHELAVALAHSELQQSLQAIREAYAKAFALIDMVGERALSRLQELLIECRTAKEWLNMGVITEDEANLVASENEAEADVTFNTYTSMRDTILSTLANVDVTLDNLVSKIDDMINRYLAHLNNMINASQLDFSEEFNKLQEALKKVVAYRHAKENVTKLEYPVTLSGTGTTGVAPGATTYEVTTYTLMLEVSYTE